MGILHRVSYIITANINDLVDRFEDPERMLRQAIREMQASVAASMDGAARAIAAERLLAKDLDHNAAQAAIWHEKAGKAVESEDDALARKALRFCLEHEHRAAALRRELKAAEEANRKLRRRIDGMRLKLAEANRKLAVLAARQRTAAARKQVLSRAQGGPGAAFDAFARLEERIQRSEAEADALADLQADPALEGEESEEAAQLELAVEEELARLRESKGAGATGATSPT